MRRLLPGHESAERVELLLAFTSIRSEGIRAAVTDHLVKGHIVPRVAGRHGVQDQNVRRALITLEQVADNVEKIKEHDWEKHH